MQIADNTVVTIDYTLTDTDGAVLDTSEGRQPLSYIHGVGNLIPGLENALAGKGAGDALQVTVPPDQAYGARNEDLLKVVEKSQFSGVDDLQVGMQFRVQSQAGQQIVTVTEIDGDNVTVDGNHPLAGATLNFDVTVVEVREATSEELEHGHVHGPGGHEH